MPEQDLTSHNAGYSSPVVGITSNTPQEDLAEAAMNVAAAMGEISQTMATPIVNDIEIGLAGSGKTLIACEGGIKSFVKEIAGDRQNHLPNTEVGVWIHYLTEGIERDFNRSWTRPPYSIRPAITPDQKSAFAGVIKLTKAQKNDILDRLDYGSFWAPKVDSGSITQEDALAGLKAAADKKKYWEDLGYYLSPNRTEGVSLHNPDDAILKTWDGNREYLEMYKKNGVKIILPNIMETFFTSIRPPKISAVNRFLKSCLSHAAMVKCANWNIKGYQLYTSKEDGKRWVVDTINNGKHGGWTSEKITIDNLDELIDMVGNPIKWEDHQIKGVHLATQIRVHKTDPLVLFDVVNNKTGFRQLVLIGVKSHSIIS